MSALTDFLLARIAEDEAWARHRDIVTFGCADPGPDHPARVLAECDAKRRIVVRCQEMLTAAVPMAVHLAQQTLTDLARPHADHPDYRQEWKP